MMRGDRRWKRFLDHTVGCFALGMAAFIASSHFASGWEAISIGLLIGAGLFFFRMPNTDFS